MQFIGYRYNRYKCRLNYFIVYDMNVDKLHKKIQGKYWQSEQVQTKMTDYFK